VPEEDEQTAVDGAEAAIRGQSSARTGSGPATGEDAASERCRGGLPYGCAEQARRPDGVVR
jgi:hypothetical protein